MLKSGLGEKSFVSAVYDMGKSDVSYNLTVEGADYRIISVRAMYGSDIQLLTQPYTAPSGEFKLFDCSYDLYSLYCENKVAISEIL